MHKIHRKHKEEYTVLHLLYMDKIQSQWRLTTNKSLQHTVMRTQEQIS